MTGLAIWNARTQRQWHARNAMPFGTQCQYMYSTNGWESFDHKKLSLHDTYKDICHCSDQQDHFPVAQTSIWADSRGALSRLTRGVEPTQKGHWACSIGALRWLTDSPRPNADFSEWALCAVPSFERHVGKFLLPVAVGRVAHHLACASFPYSLSAKSETLALATLGTGVSVGFDRAIFF